MFSGTVGCGLRRPDLTWQVLIWVSVRADAPYHAGILSHIALFLGTPGWRFVRLPLTGRSRVLSSGFPLPVSFPPSAPKKKWRSRELIPSLIHQALCRCKITLRAAFSGHSRHAKPRRLTERFLGWGPSDPAGGSASRKSDAAPKLRHPSNSFVPLNANYRNLREGRSAPFASRDGRHLSPLFAPLIFAVCYCGMRCLFYCKSANE